MTLVARISEDLKAAMKEGNTEKRDTLRFLQSAIKNAAIEKHAEASALPDKDVEEVMKRMVKQRKDSIEQYRAGSREDLAEKEESELALLSAYLPEAMSREQTEKIVDEVLATMGEVGPADMGRVMGSVMKKVEGKADGGVIREIVMSRLH